MFLSEIIRGLCLELFSHTSIYLREHPAVEVLMPLAISGEAGTVLGILLLPDTCLGDIFLCKLLRMIVDALYIMRHALRRFDHLPIPCRSFGPRTFVEMIHIYQVHLTAILVVPFLTPVMPFANQTRPILLPFFFTIQCASHRIYQTYKCYSCHSSFFLVSAYAWRIG